MSLRPGWSPPPVHLNVISGRGGLGDSLARIPAFKHVIEQYSHVSLTVYVQDAWLEITRYILPEGPRIRYSLLSEARWNMAKPIIEFDMERLTTLHLHLTDHAFLILTDALPPTPASRAYPRAERVPLKQICHLDTVKDIPGLFVIFTTDYTSPARVWPAYEINQLGRMVREAGYTPVLIGKSGELNSGVAHDPVKISQNDGIDKEIFYDLRNKTSLIETLGLMQRAAAVVGVDNGLIHLAHYTNTPIVVGYTSLLAKHRLPLRPEGNTEVLEAQVPCGGCQSRGFAINTDWRTCLFKDYACTLTMTADRFYQALKRVIDLP